MYIVTGHLLKFPKYKITFFAGKFPFQGTVKPCNSASSPSHAWLFFFRDLPCFLPPPHFFSRLSPAPPLESTQPPGSHGGATNNVIRTEQRASGQFERLLWQERNIYGPRLTLRHSSQSLKDEMFYFIFCFL